MSNPSLRRSQYVMTYGPGAILEAPDGPRIIRSLDRAGLFDGSNPLCRPQDYEIGDTRLSSSLLHGGGIVRLPSNAELGRPDGHSIYETDRFPSWSLCVQHGCLYQRPGDSDSRYACPKCPPLRDRWQAHAKACNQAIRFVRACPEGHLDDVDWVGVVHDRRPRCNPRFLIWRGGGSSLRNITIECPDCHASVSLGTAYNRDWLCSGRRPELGHSGPDCKAHARIVQRGATNLRLPDLVSAVTIPPLATNLHRLLELSSVRLVLSGVQPFSKAAFIQALQRASASRLLSPAVVAEIDSYAEPELQDAINDIQFAAQASTAQDLRLQEFRALTRAATHGAPPQPASTPSAPHQFEVTHSHVRSVPGPSGLQFRVTPVNRLRVIMVQTGYRRAPGGDPLNSTPVDVSFTHESRAWYPGAELFGEGIFIDLAPSPAATVAASDIPLSGPTATTWQQAWHTPDAFQQRLLDDDRWQLHPVFVWWHTLSHRLINALSIDSGYSSAAVRERVYIDIDDHGNAVGGALLYSAQPGGDGTLGGLIALVPEFERVLAAALRNLDACSNDPLCSEEHFAPGRYNGAACYACSLVSETSCEFRNMHLDRNLLLESLA